MNNSSMIVKKWKNNFHKFSFFFKDYLVSFAFLALGVAVRNCEWETCAKIKPSACFGASLCMVGVRVQLLDAVRLQEGK